MLNSVTIALSLLTVLAGPKHNLARPDDQQILSNVAQADSAEIRLGALAIECGQMAGVKAFGRTLVHDHTQHLKAVRALSNKVSLPIVVDAGQQHDSDNTYELLSAKSGTDFDAAFLDLMFEKHADLLQEVREESIPAAQNAQVKRMLENMVPTLSLHMGIAKKLMR